LLLGSKENQGVNGKEKQTRKKISKNTEKKTAKRRGKLEEPPERNPQMEISGKWTVSGPREAGARHGKFWFEATKSQHTINGQEKKICNENDQQKRLSRRNAVLGEQKQNRLEGRKDKGDNTERKT